MLSNNKEVFFSPNISDDSSVVKMMAEKRFSLNSLLFANSLTVYSKGPYYQPDSPAILLYLSYHANILTKEVSSKPDTMFRWKYWG